MLETQQVGNLNSKFDFKQLREEDEEAVGARCQAGRMKQIQTYYSGFEKKIMYQWQTKSETQINNIYFYIRNRLIINRSVNKEQIYSVIKTQIRFHQIWAPQKPSKNAESHNTNTVITKKNRQNKHLQAQEKSR